MFIARESYDDLITRIQKLEKENDQLLNLLPTRTFDILRNGEDVPLTLVGQDLRARKSRDGLLEITVFRNGRIIAEVVDAVAWVVVSKD